MITPQIKQNLSRIQSCQDRQYIEAFSDPKLPKKIRKLGPSLPVTESSAVEFIDNELNYNSFDFSSIFESLDNVSEEQRERIMLVFGWLIRSEEKSAIALSKLAAIHSLSHPEKLAYIISKQFGVTPKRLADAQIELASLLYGEEGKYENP